MQKRGQRKKLHFDNNERRRAIAPASVTANNKVTLKPEFMLLLGGYFNGNQLGRVNETDDVKVIIIRVIVKYGCVQRIFFLRKHIFSKSFSNIFN